MALFPAPSSYTQALRLVEAGHMAMVAPSPAGVELVVSARPLPGRMQRKLATLPADQRAAFCVEVFVLSR